MVNAVLLERKLDLVNFRKTIQHWIQKLWATYIIVDRKKNCQSVQSWAQLLFAFPFFMSSSLLVPTSGVMSVIIGEFIKIPNVEFVHHITTATTGWTNGHSFCFIIFLLISSNICRSDVANFWRHSWTKGNNLVAFPNLFKSRCIK